MMVMRHVTCQNCRARFTSAAESPDCPKCGHHSVQIGGLCSSQVGTLGSSQTAAAPPPPPRAEIRTLPVDHDFDEVPSRQSHGFVTLHYHGAGKVTVTAEIRAFAQGDLDQFQRGLNAVTALLP